MQIRGAADPAEQTPPVQLGGHRHGVGRLAAPVEVQDRVVDALVRWGGRSRPGEGRSSTSAMASLLNSIPPSTACSAASSCGGWRPKSSVGGGTPIPEWLRSSTTATERPHLPSSSFERTFDSRYGDCKPDPRRAQHPRRRNCLATANARRCWSGRKPTLFMNLWMECGYLRPAVLRRWGEPVDGRRRLPHPCS